VFYAEKTVVYNAVYHLSIALSVPEISTLKVKSCSKSRRILTFFALPNFKGAVPPKLYMPEHPHPAAHHEAKFHGAIPLSSKVTVAHTLHFKQIWTPSLQKIVRGPPSPMRCWLARLGHSIARVKISGRSTL